MLDLILPTNQANQVQMSAYMKHRFVFLGLKAPDRKALTKELIQHSRTLPEADLLATIHHYYQKTEREYHYLAIDLAIANVKRLDYNSVTALIPLVSEHAWWDSVDSWRKFFGLRIRTYPAELEKLFEQFYQSTDFWQRRVAINLQLMEKERTNLALLEKAILQDRLTDEFFIQKAIGWSLRQYSKTDARWVREFLDSYELSSLANREAQKHVN